MLNYPKISILVPTYNEETVIRDTLYHLINEMEYPNKEIIVGIDEGGDRTHEIVKNVKSKYRDIIIDYSPIRRGVTACFIDMLKLATGEIILKNDADIRSKDPKRCLTNLVNEFRDPKVGGVFIPANYSKEESRKSPIAQGEYIIVNLAHEYIKCLCPIEKVPQVPITVYSFRKCISDKFPELSNVMHDDAIFAFNVLENGYKINYSRDNSWYFVGGPTTAHDLFVQKRKGVAGWEEFPKKYKIDMNRYYFDLLKLFVRNISDYNYMDILCFIYWCNIFILANISGKIKKKKDIYNIWERFPRRLN